MGRPPAAAPGEAPEAPAPSEPAAAPPAAPARYVALVRIVHGEREYLPARQDPATGAALPADAIPADALEATARAGLAEGQHFARAE